MSSRVPKPFRSTQFAAFILVVVPAFTATALVAVALDLGPGTAVGVGFALSIPVELGRDWLIDWWDAEQEVAAHEP